MVSRFIGAKVRRAFFGYSLASWMTMVALSIPLKAVADEVPDKHAKEVLAVVNGTSITRQEVELVFQRTAPSSITPELAAARKRAILADLVRAEAMAQQAVAKGLQDEGQLALETRMAHRQLLASTAEKAAGDALPAIQVEEARNFVTNNPLLFAQRKQYTLEEVQLTTSDPTLFKRLDEAIRRTDADLDRAQRMALEAGASTQRRVFATQSEALPGPLLQPLLNARVGQVFVLQYSVDRGALLGVKAAVSAPIVGEEAVQAAIGLGTEMRRRQTMLLRSREVVNKARITYTEAAAALSAPAVAAAASAPPAPEPAASGAAASSGPVVVAQERLADLPRGLTESPRKILARKVAIGAGALLVGTAWLLMLVAVVRNSFERYWLPSLWPLRPTVETPSLMRIVAESVVQPSTASVPWATLGVRLLLLVGVLACSALPVMAFSAGLKHVPQWMLGTGLAVGWLLGIVVAHLVAHRTLKLGRPKLSAGPAFGYQALLLVLCGMAVRFL
jgi:EpsD family peptidyl-prolyl cis-trans isomerase